MGGHGALVLYLRSLLATPSSHPVVYRSASAFAPILNPTQCPWGKKAFAGYLAGGATEGADWDATVLLGRVGDGAGKERARVLVDVGTGDDFYQKGELRPESFVNVVEGLGLREGGEAIVQVRFQEGYDHSYYFISTFFAVSHTVLLSLSSMLSTDTCEIYARR